MAKFFIKKLIDDPRDRKWGVFCKYKGRMYWCAKFFEYKNAKAAMRNWERPEWADNDFTLRDVNTYVELVGDFYYNTLDDLEN